MNPSKVLLITLVGPYGEVDVAVRADLPAAELLPAFKELVGTRSDQPGRHAGTSAAEAKTKAGVRPRTGRYGEQAGAQQRPSQDSGPRHGFAQPQGSEGWFAKSPEWSRGEQPQRQQPARGTAQKDRGQGDIPLGGTLADAGIVDGMVLYLYQPEQGAG